MIEIAPPTVTAMVRRTQDESRTLIRIRCSCLWYYDVRPRFPYPYQQAETHLMLRHGGGFVIPNKVLVRGPTEPYVVGEGGTITFARCMSCLWTRQGTIIERLEEQGERHIRLAHSKLAAS